MARLSPCCPPLLLVLVVAMLPATTLAASQAVTGAAGPAGLVWQLEGPAGTVYIAGSMHLLRSDRPQLPAAIDAAYREAESLVMEIDVDDTDEQALATLMLTTSSFSDGRSLPAVAGEARWQRLRAVLGTARVPETYAATLEPWSVALLLTAVEYARLGFDPAIGVERQLQQRAASDRKPIDGLETPQFQLGLLDSLPIDEQLQLLDMTLEDIGEMPDLVDELYAAWRGGDVVKLEALLLEGYREMPRLYDDLVDRRNRNWVPQLKALLARQDDTLVVVGALHLVGDRGLIALLEREGLVVRPFRPAAAAGN
jgi:uncharacterized protein YbaP (TraB family)